ncbi:MAG: NAD(P)/FAD-dependent oxidoreductase [Proteobacteria bacterium]|nr:NAD(P)/FAD-dependent oxidoreductase [Pseudomonadota bacterium]
MAHDDCRAPTPRSNAPLTIVGAGPAGLVCAILLARAGRKVVVREWHGTVGWRFHDDFQGLENWSDEGDVLDELTAAGICANFEVVAVRCGVAFDAWGEPYGISSDAPLYYLVRRGHEAGSLDRGLLEQALEAGVEVRFGDRAEAADHATVLAVGPRIADAIAVGYVFETPMPDGDWICFNSALAPLGYSYLLVHGGRGTVASCLFTGFKREAEYVARTVDFFRRRVGLTMRHERPFGGFANFRLPRTAIQGGHLVIGEQVGFQDALAGFGLRYAFRSAFLAARSLIDGTDYTSLWRRELLPLLRASVSNRFLFNLAGDRGWRWILAHRLSVGDARESLRNLYRPSLLRRALYPLAYLRFRAPLHDRSCDHRECSCVWCRCDDRAVPGHA